MDDAKQAIIDLLAEIADGKLTICRKDGKPITVLVRDDPDDNQAAHYQYDLDVLPVGCPEYGSTGDAVKACQALLNCHGAALKVDGIFGALTQEALLAKTGSTICNMPVWYKLITKE